MWEMYQRKRLTEENKEEDKEDKGHKRKRVSRRRKVKNVGTPVNKIVKERTKREKKKEG